MTLSSEQEHIGQKWAAKKTPVRPRWWASDRIKQHINAKAGVSSPSMHAGFNHLLGSLGQRFKKGISVACGPARKEMRLLRAGIVSHFECYEFSQERIDQGHQLAEAQGLADRIQFHRADAMAMALPDDYDLVYWNNALHHMMDVKRAVWWNRERLKKGGYFAMDDYVGPTGFQWDEAHLFHVNNFRASLPERVFKHPRSSAKRLPRIVPKPDAALLWAKDPSEAADSSMILPSLKKYFPTAEILKTGGAIYHTALNNILANIDENDDVDILDEALSLDDHMIELGYTNYAIALAQR
ncbi:class I SAM-dependent methyltransferase [Luteimonas salinilitoris]|uniref:Class I SAM-dependent methyltransferase n=1 Tax=Luteimonas salinilitoris TaxID=3237697 RepID=A0ABV4HVX7_9GAMM